MKLPLYCVYLTNNSTFLSCAEKTVHQQPSGNDNMYTENFCVIVCTEDLMFMKIYATVSLENSMITYPDLSFGGEVSDINLKANFI